jgi:SMC interacting uncharacterized protein involved in chromosome segregation
MAVNSIDALAIQIEQVTAKEQQTSNSMRAMKDSLRIANEHKIALERDNRKYTQMMDEHEKTIELQGQQVQRMGAREDAWKKQVRVLQDGTQLDAQRAVKEK